MLHVFLCSFVQKRRHLIRDITARKIKLQILQLIAVIILYHRARGACFGFRYLAVPDLVDSNVETGTQEICEAELCRFGCQWLQKRAR